MNRQQFGFGCLDFRLSKIAISALAVVLLICWTVLSGAVLTAAADNGAKDAQVKLPLKDYEALSEQLRGAAAAGQRPASGFALGNAKVTVSVAKGESSALSARAQIDLIVEVLEDRWQAVALLPLGASPAEVRINQSLASLTPTAQGLVWNVNRPGTYNVQIVLPLDIRRSGRGTSLSIPTPAAPALIVSAELPGTKLDAAVIPASALTVAEEGENTRVTATVPTTGAVQISWQDGVNEGAVVSRADYKAKLLSDALVVNADFQVELLGIEQAKLPLLGKDVTLGDVQVDSKPASILVEKERFLVPLRGKGAHRVTMEFQIPVQKDLVPATVRIPLLEVPVSRLEITLPGKKEVKANPVVQVNHRFTDSATIASLQVPLGSSVALTWNEAVPQEVKEELRATANIYHLMHAEEGVLWTEASLNYEVTRGESTVIEVEVPKGVEVDSVNTTQPGFTDWRINRPEGAAPNLLSIFFDRPIKGTAVLSIKYDRSIKGLNDGFLLPVLQVRGVHRQLGMLALLAGKEFTLKPTDEKNVTRVGENQLPPELRQEIKLTVAHTFKYVDAQPQVTVELAVPEKKTGRFDAVVNSLISLSDVSLKGATSIEINVKAGAIPDLVVSMPPKVNILTLSAPSLRTYKVNSSEKENQIDVQFTQEMEGQLRVEFSYELLIESSQTVIAVPSILVQGAEVQQGRIAVESLSVMEVEPEQTVSLSAVDITELPQQLVVKTSNPILLAYKYARVEPPYALSLKVVRHKEVEVQNAAIDQATYRTFYGRDGMAVTAADFIVRNSTKQFLRIKLPAESKVWSALVAGKVEKPALAEQAGGAAGEEVLIKIINSAQGFPVQLTYQSPTAKLGIFGVISGVLPRPDLIAANSRWEIYLPADAEYSSPRTNMDVRAENEIMQGTLSGAFKTESGLSDAAGGARLVLPDSGVRFIFEKLYANSSSDEAYFTLPYVAGVGLIIQYILMIGATLLIWAGALLLTGMFGFKNEKAAGGMIGIGLILILAGSAYYGMSIWPCIIVSAVIALLAGLAYFGKLNFKLPGRTGAPGSE